MIIYERVLKSKVKKLSASQRALQDSWNKLLKKYDVVKCKHAVTLLEVLPPKSRRNYGEVIPSLGTGIGVATRSADNVYTGSAMIGIATMHKSNSVPVFSVENAVDIARMRR